MEVFVTFFDFNGNFNGKMAKIWASEVSLKRASKMQLRNVDLRYVGHSIQIPLNHSDFKKLKCFLK